MAYLLASIALGNFAIIVLFQQDNKLMYIATISQEREKEEQERRVAHLTQYKVTQITQVRQSPILTRKAVTVDGTFASG